MPAGPSHPSAHRAANAAAAPERPAAGSLPLATGEWAALAFAVIVAHAFWWRGVLYPSDFDARSYLDIASDLARTGLFGRFELSELRTYGYPLFLAMLKPVAQAAGLPWTLLVFEAQLLLHVVAAWWLRAGIARHSPGVARVVFVALLVNPLVLLHTAETLTESLSLTLLVAAAAAFARLLAGGSTLWPAVVGGSLAIGFAAMVRPANLFALPAWGLAVTLALALRRPPLHRGAALALAGALALALPMLPQLANNIRHHQAHTPLLAARLLDHQHQWGIANLKYATALPPVPVPSIYYENPLARHRPFDPARPLAWYAEHPGAGAATMALHAFGMLDPDLVFTYARTLDPWYRRPVGALTHGMLALAVLGALGLALRARTSSVLAATLAVLATLVAGHLALHALVAVEMRFALPLLALAGPLAVLSLREVRASTPLRKALAAAWVVVAVVSALSLSDWMRSQSPQIRAWQALHDR
jgi:hypothetical protein